VPSFAASGEGGRLCSFIRVRKIFFAMEAFRSECIAIRAIELLNCVVFGGNPFRSTQNALQVGIALVRFSIGWKYQLVPSGLDCRLNFYKQAG
jgi:hypothetical protein